MQIGHSLFNFSIYNKGQNDTKWPQLRHQTALTAYTIQAVVMMGLFSYLVDLVPNTICLIYSFLFLSRTLPPFLDN